ncbi:MAG: hypothetical protein CO128_10335 [Ignavibacteriales bacterium CG_4_9_14_3_um_filter_30_11]|nr:MAG: hypothetical protein CO128_10335 [Ignavibacteriales bacterium CG_4_9_14_3_um_filter_30_11]
MPYKQFSVELRKAASKETASILQWFFKTGKGDYGEGDEGFEKVLDILEDGCSELLEKIRHDITT